MGLEPTRYCYHKILSLARLPIPTLPHNAYNLYHARMIITFCNGDVNIIFKFVGIFCTLKTFYIIRCFCYNVIISKKHNIPDNLNFVQIL